MNDNAMDRLIGLLLRAGVLIAAATTLAGGIWHLIQNGSAMPDYHTFHGEPADVHSLSGVLTGIAHGRSEDLIQLGILLLILTPIARVAFSVVAFAVEHDRIYVGITIFVLVILVASLVGFHL